MANCRRLTTVFWPSFTCVFEFWCSQECIGCILFKNSGASGKWWQVWHGIVIWVLWQYSVSTLIGIGKFCKASWILFGESIITMDPKMISSTTSRTLGITQLCWIFMKQHFHSVKKKKRKIQSHWDHIATQVPMRNREINSSFSNFFSKNFDFTKCFKNYCESTFPQFSHCAFGNQVISLLHSYLVACQNGYESWE